MPLFSQSSTSFDLDSTERNIRTLLITSYSIIFFILIIAMGFSYQVSIEIAQTDENISNLIKANIGIMLFALLFGFIIMLKISKHVVNLVHVTNHNKEDAEAAREISEQKTAELDNTSRVLIKTNQNLIDSIENLNNTRNQLVENEKMASLGELVAGVAHEINTPIGISVTAASHLQDTVISFTDKFKSGQITKTEFSTFLDDANEGCQILLNNLHRAAKLISSFKQIAVDQTSEDKRHFNLKEIIDDTLLSLKPKIKSTKISVELNCPDNIELESFPGAYSQIISNLISNSLIHAFVENEEGHISILITQDESQITLCYCDDGCGVSEENSQRIFNPFYTTRRGDGGSGLGLHLVFNIVTQKLKGGIRLVPATDKGLCFNIDLPI